MPLHRPYEYFLLGSGIQVRWMTHDQSHIIHATVDGQIATCGSGNLVDGGIPMSCFDPSSDLMTCKNCQERVRRVNVRP
jgi:hypothetical protein